MPDQWLRMGMVSTPYILDNSGSCISARTDEPVPTTQQISAFFIMDTIFETLTYEMGVQESDLYSTEVKDGAMRFLAVIHQYQPRMVCFVGMNIWDCFMRYLKTSDLIIPSFAGSSAEILSPPKGPESPLKGKFMRLVPDNALMPFKVVHRTPQGRTIVSILRIFRVANSS